MKAALVIIFWLAVLLAWVLWSCYRVGAKWADFVEGFLEGFLYSLRLRPRHPNYESPGWQFGEIVGFIVWVLSIIVAVVVFVTVFVASFIWAGVI